MDLKRREGSAAAAAPSHSIADASAHSTANTRVSNALKEFVALIEDIPGGRVLDLGPAWQSTLSFLIDRGFNFATEDLLRSWREFVTMEEERLRKAPVGEQVEKVSQAILAEKFLKESLNSPEGTYCGVLLWDLLDYFDAELVPRLITRLFKVLQPNGAVLALFHGHAPARFHRYRILDIQTIELVPAPTLAVHAHSFQNREILDKFGEFRSSKTFVGRDHLREGLFLK